MKILIIYFVMAIIYLFPTLGMFQSHILSHDQWPEDTRAVLYSIWTRGLNSHGITSDFNPLWGAPFGVHSEINIERATALFSGCIHLLRFFFNEILTYNFMVLLGVALSGWAMFQFVYYLTRCKMSSFFAGVCFAFAPNLIVHTLAGHLSYTHAQWIPLYALFIVKFLENPGLKPAFFIGVFYAFTWLSAPYFGYFSIFFTTVFVLLGAILFKKYESRKFWLGLVFAYTLGLIILAPFLWDMVRQILSPLPATAASSYILRPYQDLTTYGARACDYLVPSELNPYLGKLFYEWAGYRPAARHFFERTLFLGMMPLALIGCAALLWPARRRIFDRKQKAYVWILVVTGLLMGLLSLRPEVRIGHMIFKMPSHYLYSFFPMFRAYARLGFFAALCVYALAGMGMSLLLKLDSLKKYRAWIFSLSLLFLFLEFDLRPSGKLADAKTVPGVYQWLKDEGGKDVIAEYPFYRNIDGRHYEYLSMQRFHQRPMINGADDQTPEYWYFKMNQNLWEEDVPSRLASLGVKYIVLHKQYYRENILEKILKTKGLLLIKDFEKELLFEVTAKPFLVSWGLGNAYPVEPAVKDPYRIWFSGKGMFLFYYGGNKNISLDLKFKVSSYQVARRLEVLFEGEKVFGAEIQPGQEQDVFIKKLFLKRGLNVIDLAVNPGAEYVSFGKKISVSVRDIKLEWDDRVSEEEIQYSLSLEPVLGKSGEVS